MTSSNQYLNLLTGLLVFRLTKNHTGLVLFLLLWRSTLAAAQRNDEPYGYKGSVSPALAIVVVVVIAFIFFIGFFTVYIRHFTGSADSNAGGGTRLAIAAAARGLDASVIETFPTFVYADVKRRKIGKGALECAICLNEFKDDETLRLLPKCDHVFHPLCIGAWLAGHLTCPVCRTNLAEPVEPEVILDIDAQQLAIPEPVEDFTRVKLSRSHTTGHSMVVPGEDTNRFTLKLPEELRKKIIANWKMNRSNSVLVLPSGGSSRSDKPVKARSDRWLFRKTPSFLWRNRDDGSIKLGGTGSIKANVLPSPTGDSVRADRWAFLRSPSFLWRNKDGEETSPVQHNGTGGSVNLPV